MLNSDGGAFNGYIKKFVSNAFTVIVQIALLQLSVLLLNEMQIVLSLATVMIANKTPRILQEFMVTSGGGSVSSTFSTVTRTLSSFKHLIKK